MANSDVSRISISTYQARNDYVDLLAAILVASVACTTNADSTTSPSSTTASANGGDAGVTLPTGGSSDASTGQRDASSDANENRGDAGSDAGGSELPACDLTLSPGANLASAVSTAAAGTTICLDSGTYGSVDLSGISKSATVTIRSTTGVGATVTLTMRDSNHLSIANLTLSGLDMWDTNAPTNENISVMNNVFTGQMRFTGNGNGPPQHNIIDGNTFDSITVCVDCYEGRLQLYGGNDLKITNNHFGQGGESDGIQSGGYGTTIGPGNVFEGIIQGHSLKHIDSIQLYGQVDHQTVIGNFFDNDTDYVVVFDGGSSVTVTNNVFGPGDGNLSGQPIAFGAVNGLDFSHNTVKGDYYVAQGAKNGMPRNANEIYRDNLFVGTFIADTGDQPGCSSNCVYEHNVFGSSSQARGTNNLFGLPTFVGGTNPATRAGYALTSSSLGYRAATDGSDIGALP